MEQRDDGRGRLTHALAVAGAFFGMGALGRALLRPWTDLRAAHGRVSAQLYRVGEAVRELRRFDRARLRTAAPQRATEAWEIPPEAAGRYLLRFLVEAAGLALVAAVSIGSGIAALAGGGFAVAHGISALFFGAVLLGRILVLWWRIDCIRADRLVGFLRWAGNGFQLER